MYSSSPSVETGYEQLSPKNARRPKPSKPKRNTTNKRLLLDQVNESLINQLYTLPRPKSSLSLHSGSSSTLLNSAPSTETVSWNSSTITNRYPNIDPFEPDELMSPPPSEPKQAKHSHVFTLDDFTSTETIKKLATRYGRVSHMGMLDRSYSFFLNKKRTGALSFKVQNKVAIVTGDPLCDPDLFTELLAEFEEYRKGRHYGIAYLGASEGFAHYAKQQSWTTLEFGKERVLNPMTNDVLLERSGKRVVVQNKQLLCQDKGGIAIGLYVPRRGEDPDLQRELAAIYDAWRLRRNRTSMTQAFITIYDPFSLPDMMTYLYTRGPDGVANGFAALRKVGANEGYHIDPCIAAPGAPRGISDLLVFAAMAFLNHGGVSYLSLGFEPLDNLGETTGMSRPLENFTRALHRRTFRRLPVEGKKAYHDKFRPDKSQESSLYLIFPTGVLSPRAVVAMAHMANISIRKLVLAEERYSRNKHSQAKKDQTKGGFQETRDRG